MQRRVLGWVIWHPDGPVGQRIQVISISEHVSMPYYAAHTITGDDHKAGTGCEYTIGRARQMALPMVVGNALEENTYLTADSPVIETDVKIITFFRHLVLPIDT